MIDFMTDWKLESFATDAARTLKNKTEQIRLDEKALAQLSRDLVEKLGELANVEKVSLRAAGKNVRLPQVEKRIAELKTEIADLRGRENRATRVVANSKKDLELFLAEGKPFSNSELVDALAEYHAALADAV